MALETEVGLDVPDAKKVATLAASINTHLDAMSQLNQGGQTSKMTMND